MVPAEKFTVSAKLYAIADGSLRVTVSRDGVTHYAVDAAWFRKRNGRVTAYLGTLSICRRDDECIITSVDDFIAAATQGHYGGECLTRYDGDESWSAVRGVDVQGEHVEFLTGMLTRFPQPPSGHTGWLRFENAAEVAALRNGTLVRHVQVDTPHRPRAASVA